MNSFIKIIKLFKIGKNFKIRGVPLLKLNSEKCFTDKLSSQKPGCKILLPMTPLCCLHFHCLAIKRLCRQKNREL